jgi:hypothetical protein
MQVIVAELGMLNQQIIRFDGIDPTESRKMIGIILWSDATEQKAVIWCEDQGDLAFLSSPERVQLPDTFFEVGDLVMFDVSTQRTLRLAQNTSRLGPSCGSALINDLQSVAHIEPPALPKAKILPFRMDPDPANKTPAPLGKFGRRQG